MAEHEECSANRTLSFQSLKNLDYGHSCFEARGLSRETLEHFGVGYCSKGIHAGRIAIPIHNLDGALVAYVGCSLEDGTYTYPNGFRVDWEVYNLHRVQEQWSPSDGVLVVRDFFDVFRLYESGYPNAIALMVDTITEAQIRLLAGAFGEGADLTLFGERQSDWALDLTKRLIRLFRLRILWASQDDIRPQYLSTEAIGEILNQ